MLHIKCNNCGATLKGGEITITTSNAYFEKIKYKHYATTCSKCGGVVLWDKYAKKNAENKAKAINKFARKKGLGAAQISDTEQYTTIMRKIGRRVSMIDTENTLIKLKEFNKLVDQLPPDKKSLVLEYEDKQDMALLQKEYSKPTKHIDTNSVLLLTQGIIELAIADNDEDFFKSQYGKHIVDMYNTALTLYKGHDFEITAELLLEKMRKGTIQFDTEEMRRGV